jgi:hypothetical protein
MKIIMFNIKIMIIFKYKIQLIKLLITYIWMMNNFKYNYNKKFNKNFKNLKKTMNKNLLKIVKIYINNVIMYHKYFN